VWNEPRASRIRLAFGVSEEGLDVLKLLRRWIFRVAVVLAAGFVVAYAGDFAIFKLRGSPTAKVTVNRYVTIPLKGRKSEFDYLGTQDVPCSVSLFAQAGQDPCWQLRRNTHPGMDM
jgi:hypothetical protein